MLTQEIIVANDALKGLSEEQIGAIVTLSQNCLLYTSDAADE